VAKLTDFFREISYDKFIILC